MLPHCNLPGPPRNHVLITQGRHLIGALSRASHIHLEGLSKLLSWDPLVAVAFHINSNSFCDLTTAPSCLLATYTNAPLRLSFYEPKANTNRAR